MEKRKKKQIHKVKKTETYSNKNLTMVESEGIKQLIKSNLEIQFDFVSVHTVEIRR